MENNYFTKFTANASLGKPYDPDKWLKIEPVKQTESLVDKMRPHQILFNRRQAGEKLTEEENALLDAGFPVQQGYDALIKALDEHDTKAYFKPEITDLHVGYEIESHQWSIDEEGDPELNYDRWVTTKLDASYLQTILEYGIKSIRVPYLTKKQIEAEGWEFKKLERLGQKSHYFHKGNYMLIFNSQYYSISIIAKDVTLIDWMPDNPESFRVYLPCKDINTFRYICNLLNIE